MWKRAFTFLALCIKNIHQIRKRACFPFHTAHLFRSHSNANVFSSLLSSFEGSCLSASHRGSGFVVGCKKHLNVSEEFKWDKGSTQGRKTGKSEDAGRCSETVKLQGGAFIFGMVRDRLMGREYTHDCGGALCLPRCPSHQRALVTPSHMHKEISGGRTRDLEGRKGRGRTEEHEGAQQCSYRISQSKSVLLLFASHGKIMDKAERNSNQRIMRKEIHKSALIKIEGK